MRWKRYTCSCESVTSIADDPILSAYSIALHADILSVWQRVTVHGISVDSIGAHLLTCPKELVLFWFGEKPTLYDTFSSNLQGAFSLFFCGCLLFVFFLIAFLHKKCLYIIKKTTTTAKEVQIVVLCKHGPLVIF